MDASSLIITRTRPFSRHVAGLTAVACVAAQLVMPPGIADASHLGSSTASAGSAPPPAISAIQSFQPDLFTGRATTSIPIAVPPGRKGLQPSLALTYSSSGRNGWVGVGWTLDLGYIERSTKNGVPKYNDPDTYTFMFQGVASDLVQIPDGTYRAKDEGVFLRVEPRGVSGWEVRDTSGTRYLFGQTAASQIEQTGDVFRWSLDEVIDTNGNGLTITYTKDGNQLYPAQIIYTTHTSTSPPPANQVDFILEAAERPDVEVSYRAGFEIRTAKRLSAIEAKATVDGALSLARRYQLAYTLSGRSGRSLLRSVTHVGSDGVTSLPSTVFSYQDTAAPTYSLVSNTGTFSQAAWNVREAGLDTGHENFGCVAPYAGLPWSSPTVVSSSANLGCVTASVSSNGSVTMSGCQDHFGHAWTYVYASSPRTISVPLANSSDVDACLWREDAGGVQNMSSGSSVSLQAGWSLLHVTGYHQHQGWGPLWINASLTSQVDAMSPSQFIKPQLAGDVDGNGVTDLLTFDASPGNWTVSLARGVAFSPSNLWLPGFGNASSIPLLGDWNADGLTDIAIYNSGSWEFATSSATSFQRATPPSLSFGSGTPFTGDFNGDGTIDLGTFNNGSWQVALGTGGGFSPTVSFTASWGSGSSTPLTGDFNGDGLTDGARVDGGQVSVALSNGSALVPQSTAWIAGFGSGNYTTGDFNGDGLTDVAYYDKSSGQVRYAPSTGTGFGTPATVPVTFGLRSNDDGLQLGDFNGDGLADPAVFNAITGASELANSQGTFPDLLATVANGIGGSTALQYQPSTQCDNICPIEQVPKLPFVIPLVSRVTADDGLGNSYTSTYSYQQGRYDAPTKEFRGFARVAARDPQANTTVTEFHQDEQKKGRPFRTELRDASGNLWTRQEQVWGVAEPFAGVRFVRLDQTDSFTYDGDATFRQARNRFEYDPYGNVTASYEDHEPSVTGDERSSVTTFTYNTSAWILNKPSLVQTRDASGTVVAQRRFSYDGATDSATVPTAGSLTKEEEWLNAATPTWLATSLTHDVYGNVQAVTDALGRTTANTYDATGTYLTTITNTLGHSRQFTYDVRLGQVLTTTDQNGITATTEYDPLGRVSKVIGPNDTTALPTISYQHDLPPTPPSRTIVQTRIQSGQPDVLTVYTFTDGLGRTIQTRSPAENPTQQVLSGAVEFNARGFVARQWVPYLEEFSASYVPMSSPATRPAPIAPPVQYTYDAVGRLLTTADPDGSQSSVSYDDWSVTSTDANGKQTRRTQDAFGRLLTVEEFSSGQTYATTYRYDALNNLTTVTDANGHVTTITYDSLGRKISMDDPDMGRWTYAYDAVDNLTSQTDARGVTIAFTYDALNRLTQKSYTLPTASSLEPTAPVSYTYDDTTKPFSKGKLTGITDGSGSSSFEYDNVGQLIKESKIVDGATHAIQRQYDLLGRLVSLTYPDNEVAAYTYNAQGGIETVSLQSPVSGLQSIVSNADYNAAGQVTKITYGNGLTTDYTYNPQTLRLDRLLTAGSSGTLQDFSYTFDPVGNVTEIRDVVHTGSQTFQYDDLNRLTRATGASGAYAYAYDPIGNMLEKEGVQLTYGEGAAGPHAVTSTTAGWTMTYDANGNMLQKATDSRAAVTDLTTQRFIYDAENRLASVETAQEETVTVTFQPGWNFFALPVIPNDGAVVALLPSFAQDFEQIAKFEPATNSFKHYVGNPKFDDFMEIEYGVGYQIYSKRTSDVTLPIKGRLPTQRLNKSLAVGWHLLSSTVLAPTPLATWLAGVTYGQVKVIDSLTGTLITATQAEPGKSYWVQVTAASTWSPPLPKDVKTTFVYDGDGGRVKKVTAAGTTTFLGQSYEKDQAGKTTKYVFAGSQRLASKDSSGTLRFYHTDHLGSANVITDRTGTLIELAEYTPYGSLSHREGSANVPQKFTGQRVDAETGLYFYNARYYDHQLGRFLSPDPIVQAPADPQSLNRYSYVRNNPVNLVDPSGHFFFIFAAIVAAVKAVVAATVAVVSTIGAFAVAHPVAFGAIVGGLSNVASNASQIRGVGDFAKFAAVGAASGAIGAGTGVGAFGLLRGSLGLFGGGLASAAAGGLTGGFVSGTGNALAGGSGVRQALAIGAQTAVMSAAISGALFIAGYGIATTVQTLKEARATQQAGGTRSSAARGQPSQNRIVVGPLEAPNGTPLEGSWPPNRGFEAEAGKITLNPGDLVSRYGPPQGRYVAPAGTPFAERSLPASYGNQPLYTYQVLKPFQVDAGKTTPWFNQPGGGQQYHLGQSVQDLVNSGYLAPVD